jgi:hypothetical protein
MAELAWFGKVNMKRRMRLNMLIPSRKSMQIQPGAKSSALFPKP